MTFATPRSVRANCMSLMKTLIKKRKEIKVQTLQAYIMRQFNITSATFERYLEDLIRMRLVEVNNDTVKWIEEEITL